MDQKSFRERLSDLDEDALDDLASAARREQQRRAPQKAVSEMSDPEFQQYRELEMTKAAERAADAELARQRAIEDAANE